jgi:hypothetical protein
MSNKTTYGSSNVWVFESALILVFIMLNYAFRLMSAHFAIVTKLEAEYEYYSGTSSKKRDEMMTKWAQVEVDYSKKFNDAHKHTVLTEFREANKQEIDMSKLDKISLFKS